MDFTEALFSSEQCGDGNWPDGGVGVPDDEHDVDVFALVEALDLDEALPDMDALPLICPEQQYSSSLPEAMASQQPKPAAQSMSNSKESERIARMRARNREAQARYRQKSKVRVEGSINPAYPRSAGEHSALLQGHAVELGSIISHIQYTLTTARARHQQLQGQHTQLTQRCSNSAAALSAILSVSRLLPDSASTENSEAPPPHRPRQLAPLPVQPAPPPVATPTPCATVTTTLVATPSVLHPTGSLLFASTDAPTPRPLTAFQHHKPIYLGLVDPNFPEPSDAVTYMQHSLYDSCTGGPLAPAKGDLRRLVDEFRACEASRCGCGVSDIAWFLQTHVKVAKGPLSEQQSIGDVSGAGSSDSLSFSTTFNSGPCIASYALLYLQLNIENSTAVRATDILEGAAPEDIINKLSSCELTSKSSTLSYQSSTASIINHHKRRRDASSGAVYSTHTKPLQSTAALMAMAGITDAHIDACSVRCGVGALAPLRETAQKVFTNTVQKLCGILPLDVLRLCFEQAIDTMDTMLVGFAKESSVGSVSTSASKSHQPSSNTGSSALSNPTSHCSAPGASESTETFSCRPVAPVDTAVKGETHTNTVYTSQGATGPGNGESWEEQYRKDSGLHTVCLLLAVRAELMALVEDMPALIAETPESERLLTKEQVVQQLSDFSFDFGFNQILAITDSTKLVLNMMMDAFQPFMGEYYQVDTMHVQLYKSLKPSTEQRACMAEVWMRWERSRRHLDGEMHAARMLLASLPSHIPLPHEFLSHLNALLATPSSCVPLSKQFPTLLFPSTAHSMGGLEACFHRPCSHTGGSSSFHNSFDIDYNRQSHLAPNVTGGMQHSPIFPQALGRSFLQPAHPSGVRFIGQYPEDMITAERVLQELRCLQNKETDLYTYILNTEMPGFLLGLDQHYKVWADFFVSQMMPPDYIQLCQIAATQQNRCSLFQEPFR